jgi:hypothetical protein
MSKSFRYVKEFTFPSASNFNNYCGGGKVMKKAEGGTVAKTAKPVKVEKAIPAGKREGYMRSHPPGEMAARVIARNERVMENRPQKFERLSAVNAALKKNPNMTREQLADLNKSMKPVKKADGGGVTVNEAGQRLFVSQPATTSATTAATTATKVLSKRDRRRMEHDQKKAAQEKERLARRANNPGQKAATTSSAASTTGTAAAKARGGVMKKAMGGVATSSTSSVAANKAGGYKANLAREARQADWSKEKLAKHNAKMDRKEDRREGGTVATQQVATQKVASKPRPPLRAASQAITTRQNPAGSTRQYTPGENQQRAIDRRKAMDAQDAVRQKAADARRAEAAKRKAAHDVANDARKGMNKPGTAANAAKLAGTLTDKKRAPATTASAAMAKAHGGIAHKGMTKASRGGVPAHSSQPLVRKAAGGKAVVGAIPSRDGMSYTPPTSMLSTSRGKISMDDYSNLSAADKMTYAPLAAKKSRR